MVKPFASRMARLGTAASFEVFAQARRLEGQGRRVLHFEVGEPDYDTPEHIKEAAIQALRDGYTHYVPVPGLEVLREAIAEHVTESRGVPVAPGEVIVTPGGTPIISFAILCCLEAGDEAFCPDPGFFTYRSMIPFSGAVVRPLPLTDGLSFGIDLEALAAQITPRTKMIILNAPGNPTGAILSRRELEGVADLAARHDLWVFSDEMYSAILYGGTFESIISLPGMKGRTILLDGFSKTYAMTGWRLGYGVAPAPLVELMARMMLNINTCSNAFVQMAALAALRGPQEPVARMVEGFRRRRDRLLQGFREIGGLTCLPPKGAFYCFPRVDNLPVSSAEVAQHLLDSHGIACLPGSAFGVQAEGYLRFSYATADENIDALIPLLREGLDDLRGSDPRCAGMAKE